MSDHIRFFLDLSKNDVHVAGGKGASLGEMTSAFAKASADKRSGGFVPPGFVITRAAFDRFLEETDLDVEVDAALKKVNYKDVNSVDQASNTIRDMIHDERMPLDLQKEILEAYRQLVAPPLRIRGGGEGLRTIHNSPSPSYPFDCAQGRLKRGGQSAFVAVRSSATAEDSSQASWAGELESYLNTTEKNLIGNVKKCWSSLFNSARDRVSQ